MKRDADTYRDIARKYDEFIEIQRNKPVLQRVIAPARPYTPETTDDTMGKSVYTVIGVGIGLLLLALAAYTFYIVSVWGTGEKTGAVTGYLIIAFFLTVAGIGSIAGTINHNYGGGTRTISH